MAACKTEHNWFRSIAAAAPGLTGREAQLIENGDYQCPLADAILWLRGTFSHIPCGKRYPLP